MVKIIKTTDGTSLGLAENLTYIRQHENGCYVLCPEPEASGIVISGTVYHLFDRDELEGVETVVLEAVDAGEALNGATQAIADADSINVDQEYRLTLLELGVTDDTSTT